MAIVLLTGAVASSEEGQIRIGLLLPPEEPEGMSVRHGVELAVEHASRSGSIPVALVVRGRVGQWGDDGMEAAHMVLDDGAQGLIAPPSGEATHLTLQVSGRTRIPVVTLCADSSVTEAGIPWSVRIVPRTTDEAAVLFTGLKAKQDAQRWLAFIPDERAGRELLRDLRIAAESSGVELVQTIAVRGGTTDFSTLFRSFPEQWPDGVLLWLDPKPAGLLAKYLRAVGYRGLLAGPTRLASTAFRNAAESSMEGMILPMLRMDETSGHGADEFELCYRTRHGRAPDPSAVMAYDGARLLIDLLMRAGDRPPYQLFPLSETLDGITGPLRFDREGNRVVSLDLGRCHEGRITSLIP